MPIDFIKNQMYNQEKIKLSRLTDTINFAVSEHNSGFIVLFFWW